MAEKFATPTIFLSAEDDDRLHIACMHLGITRTDFIFQAIQIGLVNHESKYGKIMETGKNVMEIKAAADKIQPAPNQVGEDEKREIRRNKRG